MSPRPAIVDREPGEAGDFVACWRLALLYHDGSCNVLHEGADLARARDERDFADCGETDPATRTRIVEVQLLVLREIVDRPEGAPPAALPFAVQPAHA